jgi:hypothetical protein
MRRTITAAALLLALGAAPVANAQTQAAPPIDPAKLQLARELFAANGGVDAYKAQIGAMMSGMSQMMRASMPSGNEKLTGAFMKDLADLELEMVPQMVDLSARVYAQNLSEQELRDTLAWTNSPSGRSIRLKMPAITQQLMVGIGPMVQAILPAMMQKTLDRACEETKCTPETRKLAAEAMEKALKPKGS